MSLVVLTYCPLKVMLSEVSRPGVRLSSAAVVALEVSLPMVVMKGEVVTAEPGLTIPPSMMVMSDTREVLANALLMVTVRLLAEQVTPETGAPLMLTSMQVAPAMLEAEYCEGKTTVAISVDARGVLAQGVLLSRSSYILRREKV